MRNTLTFISSWGGAAAAAAAAALPKNVCGRRAAQMLPQVVKKQSVRCECVTYCPDPTLPRPDSLFPPTDTLLPPLIHHISVKGKYWLQTGSARLDRDDTELAADLQESPSVIDTIASETGMARSYVHELVDFGAVYIGRVLQGKEADKMQQNLKAKTKRQQTAREAKRGATYPVSKVVRVSSARGREPAVIGTYLRVHVNPKRYPLSYQDSWETNIVCKNPDFIVVNKPAGVPSVPTIDNLNENAMRQVQLALSLPLQLHAIARLDVCTSGIIVYACHPQSASDLGKMVVARRISKQYRFLATGKAPVGRLTHLCRKRNFDAVPKPRIYRTHDPLWTPEQDPDWQLAELDIKSCEYFGKDSLHECHVTLLTGRTHQIRLQMAALGAALVGDSKCAAVNGRTHQNREADDSPDIFGEEPTVIALQCSSISFKWQGEQREYRAGDPWWRTKGVQQSRQGSQKLTVGQNVSLTSSEL